MDFIYANLTNVVNINDLQREILELKAEIRDLKSTINNSIDELYRIKQDNLVDGENIKTINETSILGEGNLSIIESKLQDGLTVNIDVGAAKVGDTFEAGTKIETILQTIFDTGTKLYFGICPFTPTSMEWVRSTATDVPEDFAEHGVSSFYTTKIEGEELGNHCVFAYPASYGELSQIFYDDGKFNLLSKWDYNQITLNNRDYYLYYQKQTTKETNAKYSFSFLINN